MRNKVSAALVVAGLIFLATAPRARAQAEHYAHRPIELNAHLGGIALDKDLTGDTELLLGARAGYNFPGGLGFEANFDRTQVTIVQIGETSFDENVYLYSGGVTYTFSSSSKLHPHVSLGVGAATFDPDRGKGSTELLIPFGVGFRYFERTYDPRWAVRGDLRDDVIRFTDPDETTNNIEFSAGISFLFGD